MNSIKMLYFSAPWCGPCKMFKPVIKQFAEKHPDCDVVYIDIDEKPEDGKEYNINAVPTCVFVKNEKEVSRFSGMKGIVYIENLLDEATI
jgi:thiol-disulfide isomerase/thioredoxin